MWLGSETMWSVFNSGRICNTYFYELQNFSSDLYIIVETNSDDSSSHT